MSALSTYTDAVARRKGIERRGQTPVMNYAIMSQLQEGDIPLLLEIIREQASAIDECLEHCENVSGEEDVSLTGDDADRLLARIAGCKIRVETLAGSGNTAVWGGAH